MDPHDRRTDAHAQTGDAEAPPDDDGLTVGEVVGGYRLVRRVGAGGMGVVYEAEDLKLQRRVALKFVPPRFAFDRQVSARLLREARATAALQHVNVGVVFEVGEHRGQPFIVMAFQEGETLAQHLAKGPLSRGETLNLLAQIAAGVACAHAAGIVHRDIKPANVMLGPGGEVKVLDFGLAKLVGDPDVTATVEGKLLGTVAYMAPEQLRREPVDARADVWALGITTIEMLTGKRPFAGTGSVEVAHAVLHDEPMLPRGLLHDLEAVLLKCLDKDLERRYRDAGELLDDVQRLVAGTPVKARRPSFIDRFARRTRRQPLPVVLALAGVAIAVAGAQLWRANRTSQMCRGGRQKLAGIWDGPRRAAVERAFAGSGKPFASGAFARVAGILDDYATSWTGMYTQACEATHERGEQSQDLLDLRMECLDTRRDELRAQVDLLTRADGQTVERAVQSAGALPGLGQCERAAELRQVVRPPTREVRDRVAALRSRLADVAALRRAGRSKEALAGAQDLAEQARAVAYAPLLAEVLFERGKLEDRLGKSKDAVKTYLESVEKAEEGRDDLARATALTELISVSGMVMHDYAAAHSYHALATAAIARAGGEAELSERADEYEAATLDGEGKHDASLALINDVLRRREQHYGPESYRLVSTLVNQGETYRGLHRFDEALASFQRARVVGEKALSPQHPTVAQAWNNIGAVLVDGKHDIPGARVAFEKALAIREASLGPDHPDVARTLSNIARTWQSQRQADRAAPLFERALAIKQRNGDGLGAAVTQSELANTLMELGRIDDALAQARAAQSTLARLLPPDEPRVIQATLSLADIELAKHDLHAARLTLESGLAGIDKPSVPPPVKAQGQFMLAQVLWAEGKDRTRARALATAALPNAESNRDNIERWLKTHR